MTETDDSLEPFLQDENRTDTPIRYVERYTAYAPPWGPEHRPYSTNDIVIVPHSVRIDYAGVSTEELMAGEGESIYIDHPNHPRHSDPDWEVPGIPIGAMNIVHEDGMPTPEYTYNISRTGIVAGIDSSDWDVAMRNLFQGRMERFEADPTPRAERTLYRDGGMGLPTEHLPIHTMSDYWAQVGQKLGASPTEDQAD